MTYTDDQYIAIAGHSGLIGSAVKRSMPAQKLLLVNREDFELEDEAFAKKFEEADVILNFTGSPIIKRWTARNREKILQSRLETTRKLGMIGRIGASKERHLINASAIGIYAAEGVHTEDSRQFNEGFLYQVTSEWEKAARMAASQNTRVSILRTGMVLSGDGGVLQRFLPLFRVGLGGRIGSGKQPFSWIHIEDLVRSVKYIIRSKHTGVYNLTAPGWVDNAAFTRTLAGMIRRPAIAIVPRVALRLWYGKAAETIYRSQAVIPQRLINEGFDFRHPDLPSALRAIVD